MDGIKILDPSTSRTLRIYPLDIVTKCYLRSCNRLLGREMFEKDEAEKAKKGGKKKRKISNVPVLRPDLLCLIGLTLLQLRWQQQIRLYCQGKDNRVNILKSIDEGPFQMGTLRVTVTEGTEGALHLGPERPAVYSDLTCEEKDRYKADIWATNILLQGLPKDIYSLINHYTDAKDI
nr:protein FREE1 [Tanacetum cinerariifolium]